MENNNVIKIRTSITYYIKQYIILKNKIRNNFTHF